MNGSYPAKRQKGKGTGTPKEATRWWGGVKLHYSDEAEIEIMMDFQFVISV